MPDEPLRLVLSYNQAEPHILDGDVLLYRTHSVMETLIHAWSGSAYGHVGMAAWENGTEDATLMIYEMLRTGGQGNVLASHAELWPGLIDVYRVSDTHTHFWWDLASKQQRGELFTFNRRRAVQLMRWCCRPGNYGWMSVLWSSLTYLPFLRLFCRRPTDDTLESGTCKPNCSQAVAYALRKAFTDVVLDVPDMYTTPGHFAHSPLCHYMFTLGKPE